MADETQRIILRFMQDHLRRAKATGFTLGLSGGVDSAVVAALAARAVGAENVQPILMPADDSPDDDERDARAVCDAFGLTPAVRSIGPALSALPCDLSDATVRGNAKARLRMTILYAEAQAAGHLVAGTGNKSELLIGYFTKFGDGGNDLQPIGDLYKTEVRELARELGVPQHVIEKPPSAGLWPGQTDEDQLGIRYDDLDRILKGIELNRPADAIARRTGLEIGEVQRVAAMVRATEHKRHAPLIPKLGTRTVGVDWRRSVHWDAFGSP